MVVVIQTRIGSRIINPHLQIVNVPFRSISAIDDNTIIIIIIISSPLCAWIVVVVSSVLDNQQSSFAAFQKTITTLG